MSPHSARFGSPAVRLNTALLDLGFPVADVQSDAGGVTEYIAAIMFTVGDGWRYSVMLQWLPHSVSRIMGMGQGHSGREGGGGMWMLSIKSSGGSNRWRSMVIPEHNDSESILHPSYLGEKTGESEHRAMVIASVFNVMVGNSNYGKSTLREMLDAGKLRA